MGRDKRAWRKLVKKLRRQRIRRHQASSSCTDSVSNMQNSKADISLHEESEEDADSTSSIEENGDVDGRYFISCDEWEARERLIELQNAMKAAEEEKIARAKAEEEKRIREEWEAKERREKAEKEEHERLEMVKKQRQDEEYNQFLDFLCGDIETPPTRFVMPEGFNESGREVCLLFAKTGVCRFGDACKLVHLVPTLSQIILIPNFFYNFLLAENLKDEYDSDLGLECDEKDLYKEFLEFYDDVVPEFRKHGNVIQFKVCRNLESHLRGNVYIQFDNIRSAVEAFRTFNGRFYNGKQLSLRFVKIDSWKSAICWSFLRSSCVRGRSCNYMHVFRNPTKEFVLADRDFKEISHKAVSVTPQSSLNASRKRSRWNDDNESSNSIPPIFNDLKPQTVLSSSTSTENLTRSNPEVVTENSLHTSNSNNMDLDSELPRSSHKRKSKKVTSHHSHKKKKKEKKKKSKKSKKDSYK